MKFYKSAFRKARVEIIPMIDTIFFLLVYFIFQTLIMVKMSAMDVNIPKPSPPSTAKPPPMWVVKVDNAGNFYVGPRNKPELVNPDVDSITSAVDAAAATDPKTLFVVSVDGTQHVQSLITCLDGVNAASTPDGQPVNMVINGQGGTNIPV